MRIALIGYGEVGRILAEDLRARGHAVVGAYDLKLGTPSRRSRCATHARAARRACSPIRTPTPRATPSS